MLLKYNKYVKKSIYVTSRDLYRFPYFVSYENRIIIKLEILLT